MRTVRVAGVVGGTERAVNEAKLAWSLGYHAALVSLHQLNGKGRREMVEHVRAISREIPVFGFYLQPSIGGPKLDREFWRELAEKVENLVAIKVAPFNRYFTLDVVRGVAEAGREGEVALYTGNDDNILNDLLTVHRLQVRGERKSVRFVGGPLGHWAFWTKRNVEIYRIVREIVEGEDRIPKEILTLASQITDVNGAVFDARNDFKGSIAGVGEMLRRSGLLEVNRVLDPLDSLSPGQEQEIDRVYVEYPHLRDDDFVSRNIDKWMERECRGVEAGREMTMRELIEIVRGS